MKDHIEYFKQRRIDSGKQGPHVLLTAGVHGDEYEPMLTAAALLTELPVALASGSVTVVTVVNRSAYSRGSRYGEDLLDLARICPGNQEGSVSEGVAFQVSELIKTADYLVDMHTGGLAHDIFPMAGYMLHASPAILARQREMAFAFNMPVIWGTDHRPDGRTLSVARDMNIPAVYLEYGGGSGIRKAVVKTYREGFLNMLKLLKMVAGPVKDFSAESRFWVEDPRPDSGLFQAKMPSPAEGIYVAESAPGDLVTKGQVFGTVVDPDSGNSTPVPAGMNGLVLSVRVSAHVCKGDALGAILPIQSPGKVVIKE